MDSRPHHHREIRVLLRIEVEGHHPHRGHRHHGRHRHHRHHGHTRYYLLEPNKEMRIMTAVTVGHTITYTWQFVDANGNPPPSGATQPVADAATFADAPSDPSVDTFTEGPGPVEQSASLAATAAGSDTVSLTVLYTPPGGIQVTFSASDQVTVSSAPFVPAGVQLIAAVA